MNIAILFGANSYEHEISIVSAIALKNVLKKTLVYIFIDQYREFYLIPQTKITSKLFSSGEYKKFDKLNITQGGFEKKSFLGSKKIDYDVVLNLVHGQDGEDGKISAILDFFNINYIGPRIEACVVSYDKFITKMYAKNCKVDTISYKMFNKNDISNINITQYPIIVKPTRLGSSIGISVVKSNKELEYALDVAFEFDDNIIIEPFIQGIKEYNLAGVKINDEFKFSIIEEPNKQEYLDFEKKYLDFNRTSKASKANISEKLAQDLKASFIKLYNSTFEGAIIRCDFFVQDEKVYINEINPIPGSMANYLFDNFDDVITKVSKNLPKQKNIKINYDYVNKIQIAKGK
jgi:D-alanine-D-alanine ligase